MTYYRYGKQEKKITFADTDGRHAELRLKLRRDGISQVEFFKAMITGYIMNDPNQVLQDLGLTERDIDFVFDLIERGDDDI